MAWRSNCFLVGIVESCSVLIHVGNVVEIVYRPIDEPPSLPFLILIKFDKYRGPYNGVRDDQLFPLRSIKVTWRDGSKDCERKQSLIPFDYALTIHESRS